MGEARWTPEWRRLRWGSLGVGGVGLLCWLLGAWLAPRQAMFSYLTAFSFGLSVALGALIMVMIGHLTGARWFIPLRRPMEATAATLPVFAGLSIPVLFGLDTLFPWRAAEVVLEPWLQDFAAVRRSYLSTPFFTLRAAVYFTVWIVASQLLYTWSIRQDGGQRPELAARQRTLSAAGLPAVVFALTFAAFDWLMSLTPGWGSTVWGVYYFAGGFVAALGLLAVLGAGLERSGPLRRYLSAAHSLALGRLLLTALLFWIYVAYSQYLVVWIGNLPSEVIWYLPRVETSWGWLAIALVLGHLLPAVALLSWRLKRRPRLLAVVGGWIVVFHYLDLYWIVLPSLHPLGFRPHWLDLAALAAVVGLAFAFGAWRLHGRPALPAGDPDLQRALEYSAR